MSGSARRLWGPDEGSYRGGEKGKRIQLLWMLAARFTCAAALQAAEPLFLSGLLLTYKSQPWYAIGKDHLSPHSVVSCICCDRD